MSVFDVTTRISKKWLERKSKRELVSIILANIDRIALFTPVSKLECDQEVYMTDEQIENTFTYHKPFGNQPQRYEEIRTAAKFVARKIQKLCPESGEKSLAFTHLQEAVMWANASIAINEKEITEHAASTGTKSVR